MTDFPFVARAVWAHSTVCVAAVVAMTTLMAGCNTVRPISPTPTESGFKEVEAVLDHFQCYFIDQTKTEVYVGTQADLQDQFLTEPKPVKVGNHILLCNPVEKTITDSKGEKKITPRKHLDAHLMCYQLPTDDMRKTKLITNQFEPKEQKINTTFANLLCVPTGKTKITKDNPAPENPKIPEENDLDHFVCYMLADDHVDLKKRAHLEDQFVNDGFTVNSRRYLCNPVAKTVKAKDGKPKTTERHHPDAHLVCYLLKDPKKIMGVEKVVIHNQFESKAVIQTENLAYFCVPSTKKD